MPTPRPGQYRGGLLGSVDYSFHGQPVPPGEKRTALHVPVAGDIASTSASLLFSNPPELKTTLTGSQGRANQAWLDALIDDSFHTRLLEGAEMCSALGGVIPRIVWDLNVSREPWIQFMPADMAVPQFSYDRLRSMTFWRVLADNGTDVTRHLEMHVPGESRIIHGVYQGDQSDLGEIIPNTDWPAEVRQFSTLENSTLHLPDLPFEASTVFYVPNMRPNKVWRDLGPQAWPLGRSDYCGVEPLMDSLDEVMTSWVRDIRLAVSRLIVPSSYLDNVDRGKGAVFEPARQVFTPLEFLHENQATPGITANQFKIRWEEHQKTCQDLANTIVQKAGYSPQSFGDYDGQAVTATEIQARERTSILTRNKKIRYWRPVLADAIYSLMCVSKLYFGASAIEPERPELRWAEDAIPDEQVLAQTVAALAGAGAASKRTLVAMAHPEWSDADIDTEVQAIMSEIGLEMASRARIALAMAPVETLYGAEQDLASPVAAKTPDELAQDEEDEATNSPEGES